MSDSDKPLMHLDSETPKLREVWAGDQRQLVPCVVINEAHSASGLATWFQCHPETWMGLSGEEQSRFRTFDADAWRKSISSVSVVDYRSISELQNANE